MIISSYVHVFNENYKPIKIQYINKTKYLVIYIHLTITLHSCLHKVDEANSGNKVNKPLLEL